MSEYPGASWLARYRDRGAIVLKLAAEHQDELRGIVGLESSAYAPGRYADRRIRLFLHAVDDRGHRRFDPRLPLHTHEGVGSFPMIENYAGFRPYLVDGLDHLIPRAKVAAMP